MEINKSKVKLTKDLLKVFWDTRRKQIIIGIIIVSLVLIAAITPFIVGAVNTHLAESYLMNINTKITGMQAELNSAKTLLDSNPKIYKDHDDYLTRVDGQILHMTQLSTQHSKYQELFNNKKIKKVIQDCKSDEKKPGIFFNDINQTKKIVDTLCNEVADVAKLNADLKTRYNTLASYNKNLPTELNKRDGQLQQVNQYGKTQTVKNKASAFMDQIKSKINDFTSKTNSLLVYDNSQEGKFAYGELKNLTKEQMNVIASMEAVNNSNSKFDEYWNELHDQYYTMITDHDRRTSTDHIREKNPAYKEWREPYTDRVKQSDGSYKNVTKYRTEDNGKPEYINVDYKVYSYYMTVKTVTPKGSTEDKKYLGKKHEKYDLFMTWSYDSDEEVGYTVWKQLWNDKEGIVKGMHLNARME